MTIIPMVSGSVRDFMYSNLWIVSFLSIMAFIIECALLCFRNQARKVPNNYILLGMFTFCEAYIVAFISSVYDPIIVLTAAFMTAGVVTGLTIYAWKTKTDFTILGACFWTLGAGLLMFAIFAMIFRSELLTMFYCILCVVILGFI